MTALIIITGVSGVGKSTLISYLLAREPQLIKLPIYTTRKARVGDNSKISLSPEEIISLSNESRNVYMHIYENQYIIKYEDFINFSRQDIYPITDWPLSEISLLDKLSSNLLHIHLKAPSEEEIFKRLQKRGSSDEEIRKRILIDDASENSAIFAKNTYQVINDNLEQSVTTCHKIIRDFLLLTKLTSTPTIVEK